MHLLDISIVHVRQGAQVFVVKVRKYYKATFALDIQKDLSIKCLDTKSFVNLSDCSHVLKKGPYFSLTIQLYIYIYI